MCSESFSFDKMKNIVNRLGNKWNVDDGFEYNGVVCKIIIYKQGNEPEWIREGSFRLYSWQIKLKHHQKKTNRDRIGCAMKWRIFSLSLSVSPLHWNSTRKPFSPTICDYDIWMESNGAKSTFSSPNTRFRTMNYSYIGGTNGDLIHKCIGSKKENWGREGRRGGERGIQFCSILSSSWSSNDSLVKLE